MIIWSVLSPFLPITGIQNAALAKKKHATAIGLVSGFTASHLQKVRVRVRVRVTHMHILKSAFLPVNVSANAADLRPFILLLFANSVRTAPRQSPFHSIAVVVTVQVSPAETYF